MGKRINIVITIFIIFFVAYTFYITFSLANNCTIESDIYNIEDGKINNISPYTTISLFTKYFTLNNCSLKVVDENGTEITSGFVYNGSKTIIYNNNQIVNEYVNIVKGDINSDGIVNAADLSLFGQYLVLNTSLSETQTYTLDIDDDNSVLINDLLLLDNALTNGYKSISVSEKEFLLQTNEEKRIITSLTPNYGLNQNLTWTSSDENIATVDESGMVTAHQEGTTVIKGTTYDEKLSVEVNVTVDNTIQLSTSEGVGYVGGDDVTVNIKAIDYSNITCESSNQSVSSCQIEDDKLILTALGSGTSTITVTSQDYGTATYQFTSKIVYLTIPTKYICSTPGNAELITVSSFNAGDLTFTSSDTSIIKEAFMTTYSNRKMLQINFGSETGRATLEVTESNVGASGIVTVDIYKLSIPSIGGVGYVGTLMEAAITAKNTGTLTCSSSDESIATCNINGTTLEVTPLAKGETNITVYNKIEYNNVTYDCGYATFLAVIRE